jgi:N6-L-threonylcarbamoyladenine synthase
MQSMGQTKIILGIETSCDDTSLCLLKGDPEDLSSSPVILAHHSFSQEEILKTWGGVVPEIAARNHMAKLAPLLKKVLKTSGRSLEEIDLIGVTNRPGLLGPLLTGIHLAKTMSLCLEIPIIPVNHIFAHIEAIHLSKNIAYPYLGLIISGGHTQFVLVKDSETMDLIGGTLDDAAGEAFDKGGKLMGLDYPAGRIIDELSKKGDRTKFDFPIGLKSSGDANLSYSGVKTSLRFFIEKYENWEEERENILPDVCASYQECIVGQIKLKMKYALKKAPKGIPIVVGGGVACNSRLRQVLTEKFESVFFVEPGYCTDNGAMIANFALRNFKTAWEFPRCLDLDA